VGWDWRPSYKLGELEAIRVNLSQNFSKISFPGSTCKCSLSGSAALKAGTESLPIIFPASDWEQGNLSKHCKRARFHLKLTRMEAHPTTLDNLFVGIPLITKERQMAEDKLS
jgi:hypothetical protein